MIADTGINQPKITIAAAEIAPFAKTGGLADAVAALSASLAANGCRVNLVMPAYRSIIKTAINDAQYVADIGFRTAGQAVPAGIYRYPIGPSQNIYFIRCDEFFDRAGLYGESGIDYTDNDRRFALFSRAVLEVAGLTGSRIIHLNDWHAAPAAAILKLQPERYPGLNAARTLLTIHNLAYQGHFARDRWPSLGLDPAAFYPAFEFYGGVNFLKSGLVCADRLVTVSPTYAREVTSEGCGFGLEGVLRTRAASFSGIVNGVDYNLWNPENDLYLVQHYSAADLSGKAACKKTIQQFYGLEEDPAAPVAAVVSRLADGKGMELIREILKKLIGSGAQFILLGNGVRDLEDFFRALPSVYPGKAGTIIGFDDGLAHRTIAGADMLLMPSQREPCGLTQLYALKYGTVPIVRRTGGLADTVKPAEGDRGDGFLFDEYSGTALWEAVNQARTWFEERPSWQSLMRRGMLADHSWSRSMQQYLQIYRALLS
ncbi:glycogen synthase GlgA [Dehalogenimonas alkenigignens]|uniref:glycogen synthase GlgA n=1 Tax=Dehalogenimonas alkenigignens TaxID=1217799 RepID=UPI000D5685E9|nr:glycogen synthase GlgA [Dehalogenimonas alkenigignens]PVV83159.1 glycogen synthase GlgA [Dehalogenimonas alkenigignens]